MPILRRYACPDCNHLIEVTLRSDQWDAPPPDCPRCTSGMGQEFRLNIGGSTLARATDLAHTIAAEDYGVADLKAEAKDGAVAQVRYKDATPGIGGSTWGAANEVISNAISLGRQNRLQNGTGLDVLQRALKNGTQVDLIEQSKQRSMRVW